MAFSRLRARRHLFALASTVVVIACSEAPHEAPRPMPRSPVQAAAVRPAATQAAAPLDQAAARQLLDRWVAAQNAGDFEAYSALYGSRFTGVKRTPDHTAAFDHDGWMRDRRRMFQRPMTVAVSQVDVHATPTMVDVRFVQRWSSGSYSDEGPKRLSMVLDGDRLVIATEEMLASTRLGELDAALTVGTFVALPADGGAVAILAPADPNQATGAPQMVSRDEPYVAVRETTNSVPANLTALRGREVTVIERARTCTGRVELTRIARLVVPHFGMVQRWNGDDAGTRVAPASQAERAKEVWSLGTTAYYAAIIASDCHEPVAVSFAPGDAVHSFVPREPTTAERTALDRAFERTSRFAALERYYRGFLADSLPEEAHPAPPLQRASWAEARSTVVFTNGARSVASVVHNSEGCGGFDGSAWATFELGERAPIEHRMRTPIGNYVSVVAVFDVDGDGTLEAVLRQGLASLALVRLTPSVNMIRSVEVDYLDCGC